VKCPPNCLNCHRPMAPKKTANPPAVVRHAAHGLCDSCNTLAHRNANPPPPSVRYADPAELLETAVPRPYWMDAGLGECVGTDPELFYPHDHRLAVEAKQICGACKFAGECKDWAVTTRQGYGIWGGLTEPERRPLIRAAIEGAA
jgi:WhiB family redox-sensing transcriptional regulator